VLPRKVRGTIEKYGMLRKGDTVVVAVSGGPDSVALLHVLNSLKSIYGLRLHVAHLEHGIRGDESRGDMKFVEDPLPGALTGSGCPKGPVCLPGRTVGGAQGGQDRDGSQCE
jgi:hypothetical protein